MQSLNFKLYAICIWFPEKKSIALGLVVLAWSFGTNLNLFVLLDGDVDAVC